MYPKQNLGKLEILTNRGTYDWENLGSSELLRLMNQIRVKASRKEIKRDEFNPASHEYLEYQEIHEHAC